MSGSGVLRRALDRLGTGRILVAIGVLLLLNPLYVGMLHLDQPEWTRYEATALHVEDGEVSGGFVADPDIACTDDDYRSCAFERYVHRNGGLEVEDGGIAASIGRGRYRYVFLGDDGFFEPQAMDVIDGSRLTLAPVSAEEALHGASTRVDRAPPVVGAAIDEGTATSHTALDLDGHVFETIRGQYYVLDRVASHGVGPTSDAHWTGQLFEYALIGVLTLLGLAAVAKGQRYRIAHGPRR